jgi:hypothetical protein
MAVERIMTAGGGGGKEQWDQRGVATFLTSNFTSVASFLSSSFQPPNTKRL